MMHVKSTYWVEDQQMAKRQQVPKPSVFVCSLDPDEDRQSQFPTVPPLFVFCSFSFSELQIEKDKATKFRKEMKEFFSDI